MTSKRWSAVPESEWVLMYRRGLGRGQIAEQSGAPVRTVGYHLSVPGSFILACRKSTLRPRVRNQHG
jgi:hypothetical protein